MSREEQLAHTRRRILDAARELFLTKGYAETSTRDIAGIVGISQPALYHHFSDKELIFLEVIEEVGGELATTMTTIITADQGSGLDVLTDLTAAMLAVHPRDAFSLIHGSFRYLKPENKRRLGQLFGMDYVRPLAQFFGSNKVTLKPGLDPQTAASFYMTSLAPLFAQFHRLGDPELSEREQIQFLLKLILFGVADGVSDTSSPE
ncbi:TetR/AcrR family transcriptional regulator [Furfurilactobacillus sp. WILCCON 0119]|uniref:TetR/AcrR family transcriptional regulator n=1 Tax=Furfurilactobacillus entadae TaxID=2922307 RepID=UPI0035EC4CC8